MKSSNLTRDEAAVRADLIRNVAYEIDLDLTGTEDDTFTSTVRITFDANDPSAETFLDLAARRVDSVVVNGTAVEDAYADGRIRLTSLADHNVVEVSAQCAYSRSGVGMHRFVDPVDQEVFLYTQFEPQDAHRVYACFDQPDIKAPITMSATAPAGWEVVSNARVASRPDAGTAGRWAFEPTEPISTYISALVAGPYHRVDARHGDVELGIFCRKSMAEYLDPDEIIELTAQGLDYFAERFDMAYPFGKYDQLFVPEFNFGAMENPGCVTFSERYVFRSRVTQAARLSRANTILHEMAHMWFGDLVTMRWWDDLWLNESFATFMAHKAVAEATRFGEDSWADFAHSMKAWAYQQDQLPSTHPIVADILDTESVMANFDGITYAKGASVLKQLHAWVGEDAFIEGLRDHFQRHAWGNAELADFLDALEGPSGRALGSWSKSWLETAGVATLSARIDTDDDDVMTAVEIAQVAPSAHPTLRPHRLGIGLYETVDGVLTRTDFVEVDIDGPSTTVDALAGRPRPDLLLLNDQDLAYAKVRLDSRSIEALERSLGTMPDGVARAVCWGSLWDATRDAELAARRFADLVCEHGPVEADVSVLQTLLRQAFACADRYGDPANRTALRERIAATSRAGLDRSEPGSDRQLIWARAVISSRTDAAFVAGLLDGSTLVEGLTVDTDLRWFALGHLAAMGEADADAIERELERDPTDVGRRGAETALAARPTADAKAEAWRRAMDTSSAMHTRRAVLRGFWQVEQSDVLADYASTAWVEALPSLWHQVSGEEGLTMTEAIYPHPMISEDVVAAADRAFDADLPGIAKRSVSEGRDATQRALRARVVDG